MRSTAPIRKPHRRRCWKLTNMRSLSLAVFSRHCATTSVVKKILRGYQRVETDRIIAFRSHWGYRSEYCNPASGHEKGGVEGELGWFRRNWLVPVPEASVLDALNQHVLDLMPGLDARDLAASKYKGWPYCVTAGESLPWARGVHTS